MYIYIYIWIDTLYFFIFTMFCLFLLPGILIISRRSVQKSLSRAISRVYDFKIRKNYDVHREFIADERQRVDRRIASKLNSVNTFLGRYYCGGSIDCFYCLH